VVPSQGGRARLCEKLGWKQPDRFQIRWFSVVGGAAGAGTWGQVSSGTFHSVRGTSGDAVDGVCPLQEMARQKHHIWSGMLEQGPDRQRAPRCCSGGVSSIDGASESRCSHDGPGGGCQQGLQHFRHWSSPGATGLHEWGFTRGSQGVSVLHRPGRWRVPETVLFQAGTGTSQALRHWPEGVICS
jgi:hypothetical protein